MEPNEINAWPMESAKVQDFEALLLGEEQCMLCGLISGIRREPGDDG